MNLLEVITQRQNSSNNLSGTSLPSLMMETDMNSKSLNIELNLLKKQGLIVARNGIHGRLVFLPNQSKNLT